MIPGTSFPAKASGRSIAPVAMTIMRARMRHSLWAGTTRLGASVLQVFAGQNVAVVVDSERGRSFRTVTSRSSSGT